MPDTADSAGVAWFSFDTPVGESPPRWWRRDLAPVLRAFGPRSTVDDVLVAAGELVANALEHGGGVTRLHVEGRGGSVLVEVQDHTSVMRPQQLVGGGDRGRGLAMVETLSDGWGWAPIPDGKSVWAWFDVDNEGD